MSLLNKASLIQIPSGYKDGTLYSAKPTNGDGDLTFSRGSNLAATRVNSEGLIEKGRENLFTYSQDFRDAAGWLVSNATKVSITETDPNGGSTAANISWTAGSDRYFYKNITSGNVLTTSFYVKSNGGGNKFRLFGDGAIDLSQDFTATGEWQRFEFFFERGSGQGVGITNASDNSAADLLVAFSQLEQGLIATDYIPTTTTTEQAGILEDMPRLDYSGGATCPSLLLEPQRSNLFAQSEYYSGSYWSKTLVSFTDNYTTSPEGVQNASRFISAGGTYPQLTKSISGLTIGQTYTASFYVKSDGTTQIEHTSWFTGFAGTTFTATDEWQRISFSITATATTHAFVLFNNSPSAPASSFLLYGLQMEAGSYPTSYIPTYGSSVTRSQDSCSGAGDSSVFNSTQGVLFYEGSSLFNDLTNRFITLSDGTNDNRVLFGYRAISNQVFARIEGNNSASVDLTHIVSDTKDNIKIAISFDNSFNYKMFVNGVLVDSGTGTDSILGLNDLSFTNATGSENLFGKVKQLLYFPTALTDAECIELTTI